MISHRHKCIFIHISKCAGSSIETAFGIDVKDNSEVNHINVFGWCNKNKIFLQHATPNELINLGYISEKTWNTYYKFIVVRNPWSRALSDYFWISTHSKIKDSFSNFLLKKGKFEDIMSNHNFPSYRGDHLNSQKSYFFLNGKEIEFQKVIYFENLQRGLGEVRKDLKLHEEFFTKKRNVGKKIFDHYSHFYNFKRKKIVETLYKEDIKYLNYEFEDKRNFLKKILNKNLFCLL